MSTYTSRLIAGLSKVAAPLERRGRHSHAGRVGKIGQTTKNYP
jgi:hypothetical protein